MAIERLAWWLSIANDQFSMTNSQSSKTALFQGSPVRSEAIYA
jgi:hypothetical protein